MKTSSKERARSIQREATRSGKFSAPDGKCHSLYSYERVVRARVLGGSPAYEYCRLEHRQALLFELCSGAVS
eukprot:scaffold237814_cov47-Prasinocladus_malaysianus.AAC.1